MPNTSSPNYVAVVPKPLWANGSDQSSFGQRRVKAGVDEIKAVDTNNVRDSIDILWDHVHEYHDSVGSC